MLYQRVGISSSSSRIFVLSLETAVITDDLAHRALAPCTSSHSAWRQTRSQSFSEGLKIAALLQKPIVPGMLQQSCSRGMELLLKVQLT